MMLESNVYRPIQGLEYRREREADIITWSNRRLPRNTKLFVLFIVVFIIALPVSIFLTIQLINDSTNMTLGLFEFLISLFFVIVGWGAAVGTLYYLLRLTWTESIKISDENVSLLYSGLLAPREKQISGRDIWRISFEKFGHERHQESRFTLNIFHNDNRSTLAYWMRNEENYQLYLLLGQIFTDRGWNTQKKSDYKAT